MAVREALSPLIRNAQARRCSLELCQKFGSQLLSPCGPSPKRNSPNNVLPLNWSSSNGNSPTSPSTFPYRRGSADQGVLPSPSLLGGSSRGRRSSLTPLSNIACGQSLLNSHHHHPPHYPIPSIYIQDAPVLLSSSKEVEEGENPWGSTKCLPNNELFYSNVIPFNGVENSDLRRSSPQQPLSTTVRPTLVKKSSLPLLDFDEDFMILVAKNHNLLLDPGDILGRGSFGTVIQGIHNGRRVAVKIISTKLVGHLESFRGERNAHNIPPHPHIARVLNIFQVESERALIVMELLRKGSLLTLLDDYKYSLDFLKMVRFSGQIASALHFCHQNGIIHLDVKPKNILLDVNDNCKLADFGTSKRIHDIPSNKLDGTVAYKAPELFRGCIPTEKCDVYSFGVCLWQMLQRENPYQGQPEHQIIYQVVAQDLRPGKFTGRSDYSNNFIASSNLLPNYIQIYEMCWVTDPNLRPTMNAIIDELFFLLQTYNNNNNKST